MSKSKKHRIDYSEVSEKTFIVRVRAYEFNFDSGRALILPSDAKKGEVMSVRMEDIIAIEEKRPIVRNAI